MKLNLRTKFILTVGVVVLLTVASLCLILYRQAEESLIDQVDQQSRALLRQMLVTRQWIADHGGVYVQKGPGVEENPHLPGSTITDLEGRQFVYHNHAIVTRILSEYASSQGLYRFHISSLKPLNPANAPMSFESERLKEFERRRFEDIRDGIAGIVKDGEQRLYHRIIPIRVDQPCLACHASQGYKVGEIRGGLSVLLPMEAVDKAIGKTRQLFILGSGSVLFFVAASLFLLVRWLVLKPVSHLSEVAGHLRGGDYSARATVTTGDEFQDLGAAFNAMTEHIIASYQSMVKTLASAIEARDPYTGGHVDRVAGYARQIGKEMELSPRLMHQIELAAILHDIGKIGVPDDILRKTSRLDAMEFEVMQTHPSTGWDILSTTDFPPVVQSAVLHHHEHFDGTGYPDGIKGENIPIIDRIIAVADAYDAMMTNRPYRHGLSQEVVMARIAEGSGTQFDPAVVAAFQKVIHSDKEK